MNDFTDLPALCLPDTAIASVVQTTDPVDDCRTLSWKQPDRYVLRIPRVWMAMHADWEDMRARWGLEPMGTHGGIGNPDIYFKRTTAPRDINLPPWKPFVLVS